MKSIHLLILCICFLTACQQKTEKAFNTDNEKEENIILETIQKDEIEGTYKADGCDLSVIISKIKNDYQYILKTNSRTLKGKATYSENSSGEKSIVLEGIQWDEYEGDITNEEENDSIQKKEVEIPVGIGALYVKDTLTIQNYGNAMNSYTKISECGLKFIQLVKK